MPPEGTALSPELRGLGTTTGYQPAGCPRQTADTTGARSATTQAARRTAPMVSTAAASPITAAAPMTCWRGPTVP